MQNHVTVIPQDKTILIDGQGLRFDFTAPADLHALQWHEGAGHIEYNDGQPNRPLGTADYAAEVAPFVAKWQAEKDRLEEEATPPEPSPEMVTKSELLTVDAKSIRAMRVLLLALAGANPDAVATLERDLTKLSDLETQAETLRATL